METSKEELTSNVMGTVNGDTVLEVNECFSIKSEKQYTVSQLINLLEFMKSKYGDQEVVIRDVTEGYSAGFSEVTFNSKKELREIYPDMGLVDEIEILF